MTVPAPPKPEPPKGLLRLPRVFTGAPQEYGTVAIVHERIEFRAACPNCGQDTEWVETREDTRVRCAVNCRCAA